MVSSGTVKADATKLINALTECNSNVDGLSGAWEGASYKNLKAKYAEFYGQAATMNSAMTSFAGALDLYEKYLEAKENLKKAKELHRNYKSLYNGCNEDNPNRGHYRRKMYDAQESVDKYDSEMKQLKQQIENALSKARSACKLAKAKSGGDASVNALKAPTMAGFELKNIDGVEAYCLPFNQKDIDTLGTQKTRESCGVWATAYGYAVLDGKINVSSGDFSSVCSAYNSNVHSNTAQWPGMNNCTASSSRERMNVIWDEVNNKHKPVVVATDGYSASNHYVTVVGIRKGAEKASLKPTDLIVMDSSGNGNIVQHYDGSRNFDGSGYGLQYLTYQDK